jgi:hypothetical protein
MLSYSMSSTQVSPCAMLYPPKSTPKIHIIDSTPPKLILLATWMDAQDTHILKYLSVYQRMYPTAYTIVLKSSFKYYLGASLTRHDIAPIVPIIRQILDNNGSDILPRMLIHVTSGGGSGMLYFLYHMYAEMATATASAKTDQHTNQDSPQHPYSPRRLLPKHVTIFDSGPGHWCHSRGNRIILAPLRSRWLRMMALPLALIYGIWWAIKHIMLKMPDKSRVWEASHNDPRFVVESGRSYIYSEADEIIDYRDIEEHARCAEENGFVIVRKENFPNSPHVKHARSDPQRYWTVVRDTWEASLRGAVTPRAKL